MPTTTPVDLSNLALWRNGFPDELFAELRRERPIFKHELTEGVAKTVHREFWMTTKHRHALQIHRDTDSFTAVDGPLIQGIGPAGSFPTIIIMDPPEQTKRRRVMSHAFTPRAITEPTRRSAPRRSRRCCAGRRQSRSGREPRRSTSRSTV
jgi:cytochrome P450